MRLFSYFYLFSFLFSAFDIENKHSSVTYTGEHPFHSWTGSTSKISIDSNCQLNSTNCESTFTIPIISFISGNGNRDSNMLIATDAFSYPKIHFVFKNLNIVELINTSTALSLPAKIEFHGCILSKSIPVKIDSINDKIIIKSGFIIDLKSFNIKTPKLLLLPIKNEININVHIEGHFK